MFDRTLSLSFLQFHSHCCQWDSFCSENGGGFGGRWGYSCSHMVSGGGGGEPSVSPQSTISIFLQGLV